MHLTFGWLVSVHPGTTNGQDGLPNSLSITQMGLILWLSHVFLICTCQVTWEKPWWFSACVSSGHVGQPDVASLHRLPGQVLPMATASRKIKPKQGQPCGPSWQHSWTLSWSKKHHTKYLLPIQPLNWSPSPLMEQITTDGSIGSILCPCHPLSELSGNVVRQKSSFLSKLMKVDHTFWLGVLGKQKPQPRTRLNLPSFDVQKGVAHNQPVSPLGEDNLSLS